MRRRGDGHDRAADPGSAGSFLCLGPGWSSASNAPLRLHKIWVYEGGVRTPLIVRGPGVGRGGFRQAPGHVVDLVPTILALAGGKGGPPTPEAPPLPGRDLTPALGRDVPVARDALFYHHAGHRALRVGDWKIVSDQDRGASWHLFDLARDCGETTDLAAGHPERVREMAARWEAMEAEFRRQAGPAAARK